MKWNVAKIQGGDQNHIDFDHIESTNGRLAFTKENNQIKKIKEDIFAFQARVFLQKFEDFAKVKDGSEKNTAYPYYDSEGIPTIGYGFNLAESSVCELLENKLQFIGQGGKQGWSYYTKLAGHFKLYKPNPKEEKYILRQPEVFIESQNQNKDDWKDIVKKFDKNFQEKNEAGRDNPIPKEIILNKKELNQNKEYLTSILQKYFPFIISKENSRNFLASLIDERRHRLEVTYRGAFNLDKGKRFDSYEQLALLSLFYNREDLVKKEFNIGKAIKENNRFKAWFEIRYNSSKGKDIGIAKRRFAESNVFGLFENTKRGEGYKNTTNWEKSKVDLEETMKFFTSLHSKFEKEGCNSYFEYVKYYEDGKPFGTRPLRELKKPQVPKDFTYHYKSYTEVFSPFVKTFNDEMKKAIGRTKQKTSNSNNQQQELKFPLENILVVNQNNILRIAKEIETESQDGEVAVILEKGTGIGFLRQGITKIQNNKTWHIIFTYDNHIDCLGFEYPQKLAFYALEENQIIKLRGCDNPLIHQSFSFKDRTVSGLSQYDINRRHIHCFKSLFGNRCSPNLLISNECLEPIATIYNLRSEGDNNA